MQEMLEVYKNERSLFGRQNSQKINKMIFEDNPNDLINKELSDDEIELIGEEEDNRRNMEQ